MPLLDRQIRSSQQKQRKNKLRQQRRELARKIRAERDPKYAKLRAEKIAARKSRRDGVMVPPANESITVATSHELAPGPTVNCLHCRRFRKCDNQQKSWKFVCGRFKPVAHEATAPELPLIKLLGKADADDAKDNQIAREQVLDFQSMIDRMLAQDSSPLPPDLRIDDGDLPLAKNFFEFATSPRFLNVRPYAKQLEAALHLFAEYCPRCSDMEFVNNIPKRLGYRDGDNYEELLERVELLEWGKCPKCKVGRSELYSGNELKVPVELAGLAGQRSGKSAGSVMKAGGYTLHRFMKLPNASQAFGLLENDDLQGTFVAQTYEKARERLFNPLLSYINNSPWFKQYNEMLDHYGEKLGERLYRINDLFISYRVRKLLIRPAGPDKRKLRGDTSFTGIIDELGWFDVSEGSEKKVKQNASEIYTSMRNAFRTLRAAYYRLLKRGYDNIPPPIFCNISSPSSKRDQMVKNYARSQRSEYIYGFHYASWEYNPTLSRKDFADDFANDAEKAWRDFGAVPPNSALPFIADLDDLVGMVNKNLRNTVAFSPRVIQAGGGREMRSGKLRIQTNKDQNKRIMSIDAGYNNNSFAIVAGFLDNATRRPVIDTLIEIQPQDYPINHNDIYENVLGPLTEKLNVTMWVTDRWQNLMLLHKAEADFNVNIEQYTTKYADFEALRQDIYEGHEYITIPKPEIKKSEIELAGEDNYPTGFIHAPIAHLLFQFLTVRDLGKSVEKGDGVTDDLFRAVVVLHSFLMDEEYEEFCLGNVGQRSVATPFPGVWASRTGGGAGRVSGAAGGGLIVGSNGPIGLVSSRAGG